jgi:predicted amidohydrolase
MPLTVYSLQQMYSNRIFLPGSDIRHRGTLTFTGQSQMVAPDGELIYRAKPEEEELFIAEIDVTTARNNWITQNNELLEDRRPEYYTDLI